MKWRKHIPFNLMKIQVEITSKKKKKSLEGNERKKIENEKGITKQMKN
jgi:hypothetical protein